MSDKPVAWMLRAARALHTRSARQYGEYRVLCGQVFMSAETAARAAERETNSWRKVEAFPVYDSIEPGKVRDDQIEAAAKAHCDFFGGEGWWDNGLIADTKPTAIEAMRAAMAAFAGARGPDGEPADWRDDMLGYAYQFIGSLMELSSDPALTVVLDAFAEPRPGKVDGLPVPGTIKFDQPTSQQLQEIWDWYDEISFARVKAGLPDNMLKFCGVKNGAEEWIVYQDQGGPSLVHGRSAFDALTKLRDLRDRLA